MARSLLSSPGRETSKPHRLYVLSAPSFTADGHTDCSTKRRKLNWSPSEQQGGEEITQDEELSKPPAAPGCKYEPYPPTASGWPANSLLSLALRLSLCCPPLQQRSFSSPQVFGGHSLVLSPLTCTEVPSTALSQRQGQAPALPAGLEQSQTQHVLQPPRAAIGYQGHILCCPLPLLSSWRQGLLQPWAAPKPVKYYVLCPSHLAAPATAFLEELDVMYEDCCLGQHTGITSAGPSLWLYQGEEISMQAASDQAHASAACYADLASAAEALQRQLLLQPLDLRHVPEALEEPVKAALVVYVVPATTGPSAALQAFCVCAPLLAACLPPTDDPITSASTSPPPDLECTGQGIGPHGSAAARHGADARVYNPGTDSRQHEGLHLTLQVLDQGELADLPHEGLQAVAFRTYASTDAEPLQLLRRPKHGSCSLRNWQLPVILDPDASAPGSLKQESASWHCSYAPCPAADQPGSTAFLIAVCLSNGAELDLSILQHPKGPIQASTSKAAATQPFSTHNCAPTTRQTYHHSAPEADPAETTKASCKRVGELLVACCSANDPCRIADAAEHFAAGSITLRSNACGGHIDVKAELTVPRRLPMATMLQTSVMESVCCNSLDSRATSSSSDVESLKGPMPQPGSLDNAEDNTTVSKLLASWQQAATELHHLTNLCLAYDMICSARPSKPSHALEAAAKLPLPCHMVQQALENLGACQSMLT
ncbi:hypothetical protein WJX74_005554 [Apatococcus lobatus]|uniref:Mediator of RNA polymerase II transcription subunit 13 n=1 Tax=Apatococcus lobatus TaxID=904363 RepID=A0AAW1R3E3_9CHLO